MNYLIYLLSGTSVDLNCCLGSTCLNIKNIVSSPHRENILSRMLVSSGVLEAKSGTSTLEILIVR